MNGVAAEGFCIPILQAKFYYIPPLEGRFQTFGGIDIWNSIPHCWGYPVWCSTMGNWNHALSIPHYGELNFYQFPTMGNWKFQMQYRNVNPSPRSKRDWSNSPFVTRGKPLVTHGEFIFHHLWLRHYVVKNPIPFSPQ